jgi:hypothetical protein
MEEMDALRVKRLASRSHMEVVVHGAILTDLQQIRSIANDGQHQDRDGIWNGSTQGKWNSWISGLVALDGFDLVRGVVPDYMHGLLLGITKAMLGFCPEHSSGTAVLYCKGRDKAMLSVFLRSKDRSNFARTKTPEYCQKQS